MSSIVHVLVDDADARIRYTPTENWADGGNEYEHNQTTQRFREGTGSLTFRFNGTRISAFGTVLPGNDTMNVVCKVDGVEIPVNEPSGPAYHHRHCESPSLSGDEEHELEIELEGRTSPPFILDYLYYDSEIREDRLAGPEAQDIQVIVDDADPRVSYGGPSGSWRTGGVAREYGGTTHITRTGGATVTYQFTGTGIEVYGTVGTEGDRRLHTASFSIDDGPQIQYQSPDPGGVVYKQRFFRSAVLEEGDHTIVITSTTEDARQFILDFFLQSVSPGSLISEPDPPTSPPLPDSSAEPDPEETLPEDGEGGSSGPNAGLIAGVTVGAVVVVALILGFLFWRRRKSKKVSEEKGRVDLSSSPPVAGASNDGPASITPYTYSHASQNWAAPVGSSSSGRQDASNPGDTRPTSQYGGSSQPSQYGGPSQPAQYGGPSQPAQYGGPSQPAQYGGPSYPSQPGSSSYPIKGRSPQATESYAPTSNITSPSSTHMPMAPTPGPPSSSAGSTAPFGAGVANHHQSISSHSSAAAPHRHTDGGVRLAGGDDDGDLPADLPPMYQSSYT